MMSKPSLSRPLHRAVAVILGGVVSVTCVSESLAFRDQEPAPKTSTRVYLEPPDGQILHLTGQGALNDHVKDYQEALGPKLIPAGESLWIALKGTRPGNNILRKVQGTLARMRTEGKVLNLSISFRRENTRGFNTGFDRELAESDEHDAFIDSLGLIIKNSGVPVFFRVGAECNGDWNGAHPYFLPLAYRKVVLRMRAQGVKNAAFVWCVEPTGDRDIFAQDEWGNYKWYPGDDVIDWYSVDLFSPAHWDKTVQTGREGVENLWGVTLAVLDHAERMNKPVIIGETAPIRNTIKSGDEDVDGAQAKQIWESWFVPFLKLCQDYPQIKAIVMLSQDWKIQKDFASWGDTRISNNGHLTARWKQELEKPRWVHRDTLRSAVPGLPPREPVREPKPTRVR